MATLGRKAVRKSDETAEHTSPSWMEIERAATALVQARDFSMEAMEHLLLGMHPAHGISTYPCREKNDVKSFSVSMGLSAHGPYSTRTFPEVAQAGWIFGFWSRGVSFALSGYALPS